MRLQWGPHATQLAEQVVVNDPAYVLQTLTHHPDGGLATVFRELISIFDARPFLLPCARCRRPAGGACAYPGSSVLIGVCRSCACLSDRAVPRPAVSIQGYDDALRHAVSTFRRGRRVAMRRTIRALLAAKGGPALATEAAMTAFFMRPENLVRPRSPWREPPRRRPVP